MTAPNIANIGTVSYKTKGVALVSGGGDILENPSGSNKVFCVHSLYVGNIDGGASQDGTVAFYDASVTTSYDLMHTIPVPNDASIVVITKDAPIYLEEGDKLTGLAGANGDLVAVLSWEEISQ